LHLSTRTLRQLFLVADAAPVGFAGLAFSHLSTRALFRALFFKCAGVIIHTMCDSQGTRFMCILSFHIPITSVGVRGRVVVKALCYKPEGRGFKSR
jgi:NADH:ubiquinone oxidoreductase subunit 5 (subunit L)/multisubunit Na+/H+ antiporter MnhA subunit